MNSVAISPLFLTDRALEPLRRLGGSVRKPPASTYVFYLKKSSLWGTDGANHTPVNPALMAYFEKLFQSAMARVGRGSLIFILSEDANCRYGIVTDNRTLQASLVEYQKAITHTFNSNFPSSHATKVP